MHKEIVVLIWNMFVVSGCSYIVFWKGNSGAWFLLAILLLAHKT